MTKILDKWVAEMTGMDLRSVNGRTVAHAIKQRMSACGLHDEAKYLALAQGSAQEREALIEATLIPETSFFRDVEPFAFLGRYVREEWIPANHRRALRALSAPCASGEEPYSMAIAFQEAGLKPDDYAIDALDISRTLLGKAESAIYSGYSFRGGDPALRSRYFEATDGHYTPHASVREGIRFIHGNILDDKVLADQRPYDVIFCRNLLIYLCAEARRRVLDKMDRLLREGGLLFVGHAETLSVEKNAFVPVDHKSAFAFRKGGAVAPAPVMESRAPVGKALEDAAPSPGARPCNAIAEAEPVARTQGPGERLALARELADQGRLAQAAEVCEQFLAQDGHNARAYCLLGTISQAMGDARRAEECFGRALYLDKDCYEAVLQLSLIKARQGDSAGAEVLRRRAAGIQQRGRSGL